MASDLFKAPSKLIILMLLTTNLFACPENKHLATDRYGKKLCVDNPKGCLLVENSDQEQKSCHICKEKYYLDSEKTCSPCFENCKQCNGPNLNQCSQAIPGFGYNHKTKLLEKCQDPKCSVCNDDHDCLSCKEGFYPQPRLNLTDPSLGITECIACEIENCMICSKSADQISNNSFNFCLVCNSGYTKLSGKCEKCPENCVYCQENDKQCFVCDSGFQLDLIKNTCNQISIPFCNQMQDDNTCLFCDPSFYQSKGKCDFCGDAIQNCDYCFNQEIDNQSNVVCNNCKTGFQLSNGKCVPCQKHCQNCVDQECMACQNGYYYNQQTQKCKKCRVNHCIQCESANICKTCKEGYFFKLITKTCEKYFYQMFKQLSRLCLEL